MNNQIPYFMQPENNNQMPNYTSNNLELEKIINKLNRLEKNMRIIENRLNKLEANNKINPFKDDLTDMYIV